MKKRFNAQSLRGMLIFIVVGVVVGGGGVFYFAIGEVRMMAQDTNTSVAAAEASRQRIDQLQALSGSLTDTTSLTQRIGQLSVPVARSQAQTTSDLRTYATAAGLSISAIDYDAKDPTAPGAASFRFNGTVSYDGLLKFLTLVENNLPKLQIVSLQIVRNANGTLSVPLVKIKTSTTG